MILRELLKGSACRLVRGDPLRDICSICCDSRCITPGALFVCLPGQHADGRAFAAQALRSGAAAVLCAPPVPELPEDAAVLLTDSPRREMALLSARLWGEPAKSMTMIGITGTKGKTTTAHLLAAILQADGRRVGLLGTNGACWPGHRHDLNHTTPESCDLHPLLRRMADDGCDTCIMEVSSLGLKADRAAGITFALGIFTNLSPDHIGPGEHVDFAEYLSWKRTLFRQCGVGIINRDDPCTDELLQGHRCRVVTYGFAAESDCRAERNFTLPQIDGRPGVVFSVEGQTYAVGMPGDFTVHNALAALTAARVLGVRDSAIQAGLRHAVVRGRCEPVGRGLPYSILLDYAHNAASAQCLLSTLRAYHPKRLVVVFGCGGERSRLRRYGMGEVCARLADLCILTEDNSRSEAITDILADIRVGLRRGDPATPFLEIPDRREAIYYALDHARPGDILAIIGKGHETTLDRGGVRLPFPEREIIEEHLAEAASKA